MFLRPGPKPVSGESTSGAGVEFAVSGRPSARGLPRGGLWLPARKRAREKRRAGEEGYLAGPEEGDDAATLRRNLLFGVLKQSDYFVEGNHFVADTYYRRSLDRRLFHQGFVIGTVEFWR